MIVGEIIVDEMIASQRNWESDVTLALGFSLFKRTFRYPTSKKSSADN